MSRLKLRDDAYLAPARDGVCILTNSGDVVLTGPSIFAWVDRLAPYLDGTHTLTELTASMPAERRQMTERVVQALHERGVVVEVDESADVVHGLTAGARQAYRRDIGFLGYFGSLAHHRFSTFRDSVVVVVGAGRMLVETVVGALCCGSRRLAVVVTGEEPTDLNLLDEYVRRQGGLDAEQRVTRTAAGPADEEQLSEVVGGASLVVYACDRATVATAGLLDRLCRHAGIPFVAAVLVESEAWLGPFGPVDGAWPGWLSSWRRLLALRGAGSGQDAAAVAPRDLMAGAVPTVVANLLTREVVRLLSGTAGPASRTRMTEVDLRSLGARTQTVLPHPFSLAATATDPATLRATLGRLRDGGRLDPEEFSRRVTVCLQRRCGVLGEVTERDFTQIPLAVSQVPVSDPVLLLRPGVPLPVAVGAGVSLDDARRAAVLRGLAVYGSLMVDPRRLHVGPDVPDPRTGDPAEDLAGLLTGSWNGFVWGHGLARGEPHEVAAAAVFPALHGTGPQYAPPVGVAAGYDWPQAVRAGLIAQCRGLTLAELAEAERPFTPIDWDRVALDAPGARYRSMAKVIGGALGAFDVTGAPGVPTLALCLDGVAVAYASGFTYVEALREGFAELLLWYQARASGDADYAPGPVPPLPPGRPLGVQECPMWTTDEATVVARLERLGWTAVAVPLDHDPAVTTGIMPYLVNVVLSRG